MARYQGKREAPKPEHNGFGRDPEQELRDGLKSAFEDPSSPFEDDPKKARQVVVGNGPEPAPQKAPRNEGKNEPKPKSEPQKESSSVGSFFRSKAGKITVITVCSILVLAVGGFIGVKAWLNAQAPTLPDPSQQEDTQKEPVKELEEDKDEPPTDDELYPDDGYNGVMPELTGDRKKGVYTFLLVGTDKSDGNTDTIMVATYDTVNQKVAIMSIPRDTMINEKWDIKKINSVYSRTGSSIDALADRIKKLVGFKPDYYIKVKLSMFVELVDLVGGVEFYVPQDMNYDDPYQDLHIHLKEGLQTLDGEKAMELVRFRRYPQGDIQRVKVQQDFMKALIQECISLKHWGKVKAYIDLAMENIETNMETGTVVWFAANVLGINAAPTLKMEDVYTCTLPGNYGASAWSRATKQNQSYVTIYPKEVVEIVNEHFNPYEQKVTTSMLDAMSVLKNGDIASSTGNLKDQQHNRIMAVKRGEAYYDDNGNIVMGKPPVEPEPVDPNQPPVDPNVPPVDPNVPPVDPSQPPVDPNVPPVDPSQPPVDPNVPPVDPQLPPVEPMFPDQGGQENGGGEIQDPLQPSN